ncbi:MAG: hypothetical protein DRJ07_15860 [Bacteroidetes bacterium]|nr:MAG: hypothetical protein DRJ07_15860 [Bacteroidota bacterium]
MKTLIRHFHNPLTRGGTTIALLVDDKTKRVMGRGLAICSDKDQFCRKTGRILASERAAKAVVLQEDCPINKIRRPHLKNHIFYTNKCMYQPALSSEEYSWVKKSFREKKSNESKS